MFKQEKGITLVALVITIIVLIILATISISLVFTNGGLIDKTTKGAENYQKAANAEELELQKVNEFLQDY